MKRQCNHCAEYFDDSTIDGAVHLASCRMHNGYKNYETWNVALWLDNDRGEHDGWREAAKECLAEAEELKLGYDATLKERAVYLLSMRLKEEISEGDAVPELEGTYGDLLMAALEEVDWAQIAENILEGL